VAGTALFIIFNAISIAIGWWTGTATLVQMFPDDAPAYINTALGFMLLGIGELSLVLRHRRVVIAAAGAVLLLAAVELGQMMLGVNLGVDTLLAVPFVGADSLTPGRMSANTAVCFLLMGIGQLLMPKTGNGAKAALTTAIILKSVAGGIAFLALLGYVDDLKTAYGWTNSVGMGVRSCLGFFLLIAMRIAAQWKSDIVDQPSLPAWFLPFLGISALAITGGLTWVFSSSDARPFSLDPIYMITARRLSITVELCTALLIAIAALGVTAARRKAVLAAQQTSNLRIEIEKRKDAEQALRSNNESLREHADILDLYGFTRSEALGRTSHQLLQTTFPQPLPILEAQLLASGTWEGELSHRTRNGDVIDVASMWLLQRDAQGRPTCILESNTDITERKLVERKLGAQVGRLDLLNNIARAIGERQDLPSIFQVVIGTLEEQLPIDFGFLCLYAPPDALVVAGVGVKSYDLASQLELTDQVQIPIGHSGLSRCVLGELVYEPDTSAVQIAFPQRLAAAGLGAMVAAPLQIESKVFGALIVARREARSFSGADCEFINQVARHVALAQHQTQLYGALDVAYRELRQTQQAVMRQEKLRVLGQMASGIAHDINNALSPAAIEGVAQTVARMKEAYSQRDTQVAQQAVHMNRVIEHVIDLTRARWSTMPLESGRVISVTMELASDLPTIAGNESEIRDALANLILNAADAMPEGGDVTLRSRTTESGGVQVEVTDTGVGMDEATRSRCLELFFTTKGARGTGLGLAMVYGTVERLGGEIQIVSEPGVGTTIRLILPATTVTQDCAATGSSPMLWPSPQRILIIDDDPIILRSMLETLERDGHSVAAADGGRLGIDAFRAAHQRNEPFGIVITDLGMPRVDGRAVAAAVKSLSPRTPVVLLTGWGHRMLADNDEPANVDRVLGKPPKLALLRSALAELTAPAAAAA
jgi:signal transduction histidine kinase/PAS domain-containing protein/ActR/RegA family two-component response regulator